MSDCKHLLTIESVKIRRRHRLHDVARRRTEAESQLAEKLQEESDLLLTAGEKGMCYQTLDAPTALAAADAARTTIFAEAEVVILKIHEAMHYLETLRDSAEHLRVIAKDANFQVEYLTSALSKQGIRLSYPIIRRPLPRVPKSMVLCSATPSDYELNPNYELDTSDDGSCDGDDGDVSEVPED